MTAKIAQAKQEYLVAVPGIPHDHSASADAFVQRLVTYLQARQYELLKAYKSIEEKEERERLVNSITGAIRRSLNSADILRVAALELGKVTKVSRCLIYQYRQDERTTTVAHEYLGDHQATSLHSNRLRCNPLLPLERSLSRYPFYNFLRDRVEYQ